MGAAAALGRTAERPLGVRRHGLEVGRERPLGLFHGGRRGSGQRRKVSFFLFDGDWLWRAMGFVAAKTPATLLRRKSTAAWFCGQWRATAVSINGYQS